MLLTIDLGLYYLTVQTVCLKKSCNSVPATQNYMTLIYNLKIIDVTCRTSISLYLIGEREACHRLLANYGPDL